MQCDFVHFWLVLNVFEWSNQKLTTVHLWLDHSSILIPGVHWPSVMEIVLKQTRGSFPKSIVSQLWLQVLLNCVGNDETCDHSWLRSWSYFITLYFHTVGTTWHRWASYFKAIKRGAVWATHFSTYLNPNSAQLPGPAKSRRQRTDLKLIGLTALAPCQSLLPCWLTGLLIAALQGALHSCTS